MERVEIPKKEVFERAEVLEQEIEEAPGEGQPEKHFQAARVTDLLKVTQYYKTLLDRLLSSPADGLLATAENYVRGVESGTGPVPLGEDEVQDRLDEVAEAYRFYKSRYQEATMGLGTCPMGHEHLMRLQDESTPEYMTRVMRAFKDFGIDAATQIGKERLPRVDELPASVSLPESVVAAVERAVGEDGVKSDDAVIDAEFTAAEEDPEPEKSYLGRFTCSLLMAEARFKTSLVKQSPGTRIGATGERPGGGTWMDVIAPGSVKDDIAKLAKLCGMTQEGDWTEVEENDDGPSGAVSGAESDLGVPTQDEGADGGGA